MSEDERTLWLAYQADPSIANRNRLATRHHNLVVHIARKKYQRLAPSAMVFVDDLVSFGTFGLFQAIERFSLEGGASFPTYATLRISGAMEDGLRELDWLRPLRRSPNWQKDKAPEQIFFSAFERESNDSGRGFNTIQELLSIEDSNRMESRESVKLALTGLSKIERIIVTEYYCHGVIMRDIAASLNLSESRISQMMKSILQRIRERWPNGIDAA